MGETLRTKAKGHEMTPAGQRWTRNTPKEAGWYWFRNGTGFQLMKVWALSDELRCNFADSYHSYSVSDIDAEWQGPLTPNEATE